MNERCKILHARGEMLEKCRQFFAAKKILEVDCAHLTSCPAIDTEIEPIAVQLKPTRYLHTSPEYAMKRLLAEGIGDIYQLSHVFRKEELGSHHNPEFMLIEWYRENISYTKFLEEVVDLIHLFLPKMQTIHMSYREIFIKKMGIDPFFATENQILDQMQKHSIQISSELKKTSRDGLLQLVLSHLIEPSMDKQKLTIIDEFPKSQAALAKTFEKDHVTVAERFEVYFEGLELANGYHELNNSKEQRKRFEETNSKRPFPLPLDDRFIQAVDYLKDTFGVAVGFDRLFMLQQKKKSIAEIFPFYFDEI